MPQKNSIGNGGSTNPHIRRTMEHESRQSGRCRLHSLPNGVVTSTASASVCFIATVSAAMNAAKPWRWLSNNRSGSRRTRYQARYVADDRTTGRVVTTVKNRTTSRKLHSGSKYRPNNTTTAMSHATTQQWTWNIQNSHSNVSGFLHTNRY